MWPFAARGNRAGTIAPEPTDLPPFDAFARNDARIKIWLTQPLSDRIGWLSNKLEVSRPDVLRGLLFEHLYGRVALEALKEHVNRQKNAQASRRQNAVRSGFGLGASAMAAAWNGRTTLEEEVTYSARDVTPIDIRFTGKAVDDFTLELPRRLRDDLDVIAKKHGLTPSSYARKMLVLQLLGEQRHTDWQQAIGRLPPDVHKLEKD